VAEKNAFLIAPVTLPFHRSGFPEYDLIMSFLWVSLPALFYLVLNSFIFFESMKIFLD